MSVIDHRRLTNAVLRLDIEGLRRGVYSDKYFENVVNVLEAAAAAGYTFAGQSPRPLPADPSGLRVGDVVVEAQLFNRCQPSALVAGVDVALAMIRHATGYFDGDHFVDTSGALEVEAVEDGVFTHYSGDAEDVQPVLKIRGRYRDFALLETPLLGVLTRATRIATRVYEALVAARGKPVLYFPARFDLPETQALDGYAYWLAVQRYNRDSGRQVRPSVSTDAQAAWWGGRGGGTVPHALIACFLADTVEAMLAFARTLPVEVPRIALVDFENNTVGTSLAVIHAFWQRYHEALQSGDVEAQRRWTLNGVRLDTASGLRDVSLPPDAPTGVNPPLVRLVREALDHAWMRWNVPLEFVQAARDYCRSVKIVVTGGFNREKIDWFEREGAPVDVYGVGSTFLRNDSSADYTMDVVRVWLDGQWVDMAKVGRKPNDNADLQRVDLGQW